MDSIKINKLDSTLTNIKEAEMEAKEQRIIDDILNFLRSSKRKVNIIDIANYAEMSPRKTQDILKELISQGMNIEVDMNAHIELSKTIPRKNKLVIKTEDYFGKDWIRFGVIADTHLCSKYSRLDVLNALYDIYEKEGIQTVYHGGNWIDGEASFNRYDLHCVGVENQVKYFIENYPKRKGIKTYIISGDDHEGWYVQREHINIGRVMQDRARESGRDDLIDLGYIERDIEFKKGSGKSIIRVIHSGGGSTYAISYTAQKYVESLQGGEKPSVVVMGHFHKFDVSYPREVLVIQPGSTQDQTPFLRKRKIQSMIGGCIVELKQDNKGVFVRQKVEWFPFFDKKYYSYKW